MNTFLLFNTKTSNTGKPFYVIGSTISRGHTSRSLKKGFYTYVSLRNFFIPNNVD